MFNQKARLDGSKLLKTEYIYEVMRGRNTEQPILLKYTKTENVN